jgi:hypothetical protein
MFLILLPPSKSNLMNEKITELLGKEDSIDNKGNQIWKINGWLIMMNKPNIITYYPKTARTIFD